MKGRYKKFAIDKLDQVEEQYLGEIAKAWPIMEILFAPRLGIACP